MKKLFFIISVLIMIIMNSVLVFKADDNEDETSYLNNFACHYYMNINNNYIVNESNTYCALQSFGHLLMYWDTYWDDSFINDEQYVEGTIVEDSLSELSNACSPGVTNIIYGFDLSVSKESNEYYPMIDDFYTLVKMNSEPYKSFLSCLVDVYESNNARFKEVLTSGTTFSKVYEKLITSYFDSNYCSFEDDYFDLNYNVFYDFQESMYSFEDHKEEVISFVSQGYPVMIGMYDVDNGALIDGHCCVVYDYDAITGKLYAFTDSPNADHEMVLNNHFEISNNKVIADYFVICPKNNQSHQHSQNYYVYDESNYKYTGYCACQLLIHQHKIVSEFASTYNSTFCYTNKCYCGLNENISHQYYVAGDKHYCSICDYYGKHEGLFIHNNQFSCSGTCNICLFELTLSHEWQQSGSLKCCRLCGRYSTVESPILKKKEEEENE